MVFFLRTLAVGFLLALGTAANAEPVADPYSHPILELKNEDATEILSKPDSPSVFFPANFDSEADGLRAWIDGYFSALNRFGQTNLLGHRDGAVFDPTTPQKEVAEYTSHPGEEKEDFIPTLEKGWGEKAKFRLRLIEKLKAQNLPADSLLRAYGKLKTYGVGELAPGRQRIRTFVKREDWEAVDFWAVGYLDGYLSSRKLSFRAPQTQAMLKHFAFMAFSPWPGYITEPYNSLAGEVRERLAKAPKTPLQVHVYSLIKRFELEWDRNEKLYQSSQGGMPK